jgi:hypothetical protein
MALEERPLVDVQIPIGDADGEVAECVGCDVDAAGRKTVALHRREGSIVPDDFGDWIRRRHVTPPPQSYEMQEALDLGIGAAPIVLVKTIPRHTRPPPPAFTPPPALEALFGPIPVTALPG